MTTLAEGVADLTRGVELARGHLDPTVVDEATALVSHADSRQGAGLDTTVVALLGATGAGKSSLFNAIAGTNLARVAARRPTTAVPAAVSGGGHGEVLDWLDVPERHELPGVFGELSDRLILLDLPDIDSTETRNRETAARLAGVVDVLIWVLDPQKYADAVVHEDYLIHLAEHSDVTIVVLNRIDQVKPADRAAVIEDATNVLRRDGIEADIITTSAVTGEGVHELRVAITEVASRQQAAAERLAADLRSMGSKIGGSLTVGGGSVRDLNVDGLTDQQTAAVARSVASAGGVDTVVRAVSGSYRHRALKYVGWPPLRWLRNMRIDPLRALHLDKPAEGERAGVTGLTVSEAKASTVRSAIRTTASEVTEGMPRSWRRDVVEDVENRTSQILDSVDETIARTDLEQTKTPAWWKVVGLFQWLFFAVALAGLGWLAALWVAGALQFNLDVPILWDTVPWPAALLIVGVVLGLLLTWIGRILVGVGARRRGERARARLESEIAQTVRDHVGASLTATLQEANELRGIANRLRTVRIDRQH